MNRFLATSEITFRELLDAGDRASKAYAKCHSSFGDSGTEEKLKPSDEFFGIFVRFVDDLHKSFPKDKQTITSLTRKHKLGQKLGNNKSNKAGDGMASIIKHIKSGGARETVAPIQEEPADYGALSIDLAAPTSGLSHFPPPSPLYRQGSTPTFSSNSGAYDVPLSPTPIGSNPFSLRGTTPSTPAVAGGVRATPKNSTVPSSPPNSGFKRPTFTKSSRP